jgi:WD40 repeat protein
MKVPNLTAKEEIVEQQILELSATTQLSDYVSAIVWSPNGNTFAAACCNGEVHLIQSFVGMMLCPPTGNSIDALAFSHDGHWLAAGGLDGQIRLWRIDNNIAELFDTIETGAWVCRLAWNPTRTHLAFNLGKSVRVWDVERAEVVTNLPGVASPQDWCWSPDGKYLAVATKNDIHIWNSHNWNISIDTAAHNEGIEPRRYQWELDSPVSTLAWSPDGAYLACAILDRSIGVLDRSKVKYLQEEPVDEADLPTLMTGFPGQICLLMLTFPHCSPPLLVNRSRCGSNLPWIGRIGC